MIINIVYILFFYSVFEMGLHSSLSQLGFITSQPLNCRTWLAATEWAATGGTLSVGEGKAIKGCNEDGTMPTTQAAPQTMDLMGKGTKEGNQGGRYCSIDRKH